MFFFALKFFTFALKNYLIMKKSFFLLFILHSFYSFSQLNNDVSIISKGWAPYTKVPIKQKDTLELFAIVKNIGLANQNNLTASVTIDGNLFNTSTAFSLLNGTVDTILLGEYIPSNNPGTHTFSFNVTCNNDEDLSNNTKNFSIEYTLRNYSYDNGIFSGNTYGNYLNKSFGNCFYFNESDTITSVSLFIPQNTSLGSEYTIDIYHQDFFNSTYYWSSNFYTVTQNDLGHWKNIPVQDLVIIPSNESIMVWINDYNSNGSLRALSSNSCYWPSWFFQQINNYVYPSIIGNPGTVGGWNNGNGYAFLSESPGVSGNFMIRLNTYCVSSETSVNLSSCTPITFDNELYTESGIYKLTYQDINGCDSIINLNITIPKNQFQIPLCLVGNDNVGHNRLIWEKPVTTEIDSFKIYKETQQSGIFSQIGSVAYSDSSLFIDLNSNPEIQAYRYKISAIDTCGNDSDTSSAHKTIHLTINQGVGQNWNLIWSHYEGFNFLNYNIYRGTNPNNMSLLTTIASNLNSYTDQNAPSGIIYYQIEAVNPNGCNPSKSLLYSNSRSNISTNDVSSLNYLEESNFLITPNPTSKTINIKTDNYNNQVFTIIDQLGRVMYSDKLSGTLTEVNLSSLSNGIYILKIDGVNQPKQIIKE
jgi:hypothetical protein